MQRKTYALVLAGLLSAGGLFAGSASFEKGEELLLQNKPAEARPLLEQALAEDPTEEKTYLYLGLVNQQLGDTARAITMLRRGLAVSSAYKDLFCYNIGNALYSQGDFTFAEEMYSNALETNKKLAEAYLNRANARLKLEKYDGALSDYTLFLQLRPQDAQRPQIEEVMRLIRQMLDTQETKRKEQEARQKALMNEVLNSLTNAGEDTKNVSVESLQFKNETEDVDIKE
jgi:tetratricopeptide (TPR) repeat protein